MAQKKKFLVIGDDSKSPLLNVTTWNYFQNFEVIVCGGTAIAIDIVTALYPFAATIICSEQPLNLVRVMKGHFGVSGVLYHGPYFITDDGSAPSLEGTNVYPIPPGLVDMAEVLSIVTRGLRDYAERISGQIRSSSRG